MIQGPERPEAAGNQVFPVTGGMTGCSGWATKFGDMIWTPAWWKASWMLLMERGEDGSLAGDVRGDEAQGILDVEVRESGLDDVGFRGFADAGRAVRGEQEELVNLPPRGVVADGDTGGEFGAGGRRSCASS